MDEQQSFTCNHSTQQRIIYIVEPWTPQEDAYLKQIAKTFTANEITKRLNKKFKTQRCASSVKLRRAQIVPDHGEEPIGFTRLIDIAWSADGYNQKTADSFVRRRAIAEKVISESIIHGRTIQIVPNEWADKIVDEMSTYLNEWIPTSELARRMGFRHTDQVVNRLASTKLYPALRSARRIFIMRNWRWHPDDAEKAIEEVLSTKDRQRWLRKHWWNAKTAAECMRIKPEVLAGLVTTRVSYWGAPLSMLVREEGLNKKMYYEPESVRAFTAKMDERRMRSKKKVGVDETPTKPDAGIP